MRNLFAAASYSFNNFYNNLNMQGQMIFSVIMLLIIILCVLLFVSYLVQEFQNRKKIRKFKQQTSDVEKKESDKVQAKNDMDYEGSYITEKTEIEDIASAIEDALKEDAPITLTNFEEDQEKTAIISIDELMLKAKELKLINDEEETGVNYLEKYNLEPAQVDAVASDISNKEVKAFKVSQVISPIYGVKKDVYDEDEEA